MATIIEILAADKVGDSRADLNTNFGNLNTGKLESTDIIAAIAGLTGAADKGILLTAADSASTFDLTAAGLALLDDASAADQLTTLGATPVTKTQAVDITSSSAVLTLNTSYGINYHLLTESTVLGVPDTSGWANGDTARLDLLVKVDAAGTYAMTFNASWNFDGKTAPTLTATAGAVDHIVVTVTKTAGLTFAWAGLAGADIGTPA